jgi:protein SCO1
MIEHSATPAGTRQRLRFPLLLLAAAALVGIGGGALAALLTHRGASSPTPIGGPAATWPAGARLAPAFALRDEDGRPVSLAALRGRTVIVTFMDPVCQDFCPLEAKVLNTVVGSLPRAKRPAIVAVSVNRWANARATLLQDVRRWRLLPEWRWGIGSPRALARVWHDYGVAVQDTPKTSGGVTVHEIAHTEAAYLIDASGHQRAVYMWPFTADDVLRTIPAVTGD